MNRCAIAGLAALAAAGTGGAFALAQPATAPVVAIVHVDIGPPAPSPGAPPDPSRTMAGAVAKSRSLLLELAAGCTPRIGCHRFEVLEQVGRPNHFTLVETWDSQAALDAFEASDLSRQVRGELQSMLGGPLDERLHSEVK